MKYRLLIALALALVIAAPVAAADTNAEKARRYKEVVAALKRNPNYQGRVEVIASYELGYSTFYRVLLDDTECLVQQVPNGSLTPDFVVQSCKW